MRCRAARLRRTLSKWSAIASVARDSHRKSALSSRLRACRLTTSVSCAGKARQAGTQRRSARSTTRVDEGRDRARGRTMSRRRASLSLSVHATNDDRSRSSRSRSRRACSSALRCLDAPARASQRWNDRLTWPARGDSRGDKQRQRALRRRVGASGPEDRLSRCTSRKLCISDSCSPCLTQPAVHLANALETTARSRWSSAARCSSSSVARRKRQWETKVRRKCWAEVERVVHQRRDRRGR